MIAFGTVGAGRVSHVSRVFVIGWLAAGLGAVGPSAETASAGGIARAPLDSVVNVRAFGAVGDGHVDDWAAFRAALARVPLRGGTLRVPAGDYRMGRELSIDRGDIAIVCDAGARFVVGGPSVKLLHFRGDKARGGRMSNVSVSGCGFFDPDPLAHVGVEESHGIVLLQVDRATLRDLDFQDIGDESVDIIFSSEVRLLDSRSSGGCAAITHPHAGSFSINSSSRVQLRGNLIESNANGSAIRVEVNPDGTAADHLIIADNQIFQPADRAGLGMTSGTAILVNPARSHATVISITGNQIVNPYRYGIVVHPVFDGSTAALVIQGNTVTGGGQGIDGVTSYNHGAIAVVGRSALGAVVGNVIQGWGAGTVAQAGIRVSGGALALVGNAVQGVAGPGVDVSTYQGRGNAIVGNLLPDTSGVRHAAGNLSGMNRVDETGAIQFDGVGRCRALSTAVDGKLICIP